MQWLVRSIWLILVSLVICQGALQCFSPGRLARLHRRLARTLQLESPAERASQAADSIGRPKASTFHRILGFFLMLIGLMMLLFTVGLIR